MKMKSGFLTKVSLGCLLCLLILVSGCCFDIGCFDIGSGGCPDIGDDSQAKYERTDSLHSTLEPNSTVVIETKCGHITVTGADVTDCNITAKIYVQAPIVQEARRIAKQVKVQFIPVNKTLNVKVKKPHLVKGRSVEVCFDITVPKQTHLNCSTSFGSIKIVNIFGDVKGKTSLAPIECKDVKGMVHLNTSHGSILCQNVTPDELIATSCFGGIEVTCSPSISPKVNVNLSTLYGNIELVTPTKFAGHVDLKAHYGLIETDLPIITKRAASKHKINGTIGQGKGKLNLKTCFGFITMR
jgi:hypothetical protein